MNKLAQVNIGETFNSPFGKEGAGGATLGDLVSLILRIAFVGAGLLILFMFVFAGWNVLMGAGQNNPEQAAKGKQAISAAVLGFVVVFVAYWIVRIIELIIGVQFISQSAFG